MASIGISTDFDFMNQKGLKSNSIVYVDTNSFYDKQRQARLIEKNKLTGLAMASKVKDLNKDNAAKSIKILKTKGMVEEYDDGKKRKKFYVIKDRNGRTYVRLPEEFARELIALRNSETVMVYLYLYKKWDFCINSVNEPRFTCGDILVDVFGYDWNNGRVYKKVQNILADLKGSGLIDYKIKPMGKTFVRVLTSVNTEFTVKEEILAAEEKIPLPEAKTGGIFIEDSNVFEENTEIENSTSHMVKTWGEWKKNLIEVAETCPQILDAVNHPTWQAFNVAEDIRQTMFREVCDACKPVEWKF